MNTLALRSSPVGIARHNWRPVYYSFAILILLVLQLCCGTQPEFAGLVAVFALLTYLAVNACGGLATLTGFCIFYLAMQNVLVSQVAKVALWQPADNGLRVPLETMEVYVCVMTGIYLAAVVARKLGSQNRKALFLPETDPVRLMWLAVIFSALDLFQMGYIKTQNVYGNESYGAGLIGVLQAASFVAPLAIASGTAYTIVSSRGRRSIGILNAVAIAGPLILGILGASRDGMIMAISMYFVTCYAFRFHFRFIHYAVLIVGMYVAQFILFPYALYARNFIRTSDTDKNTRMAISLLMDVINDPAKYQKLQDVTTGAKQKYVYYGVPMASLDRFSLIEVADGIVDATLRQGTTGMDSITGGLLLAIPHMFSPDKYVFSPGNELAHREPGLVGKRDHSTGITTGFACDSFSSYSWLGAVLIPFLLTLVLLPILRFIFVDRLWFNVYALSLFTSLPHLYSEDSIAAVIVFLLQVPLLMILVFGFARFLTSSAMRTRERLRQTKRQGISSPRINIARGRSPFDFPQ